MPRNANNDYYHPVGTEAVPGETATAAQFNARFDAVKDDLNAPRPIKYGGTGATTPSAARSALGVASQSDLSTLEGRVQAEEEKVQPIELGGTGATTAEAARAALDVDQAGSTAPDSLKLGGHLPAYFLPASATAVDAAKLDGRNPSAFPRKAENATITGSWTVAAPMTFTGSPRIDVNATTLIYESDGQANRSTQRWILPGGWAWELELKADGDLNLARRAEGRDVTIAGEKVLTSANGILPVAKGGTGAGGPAAARTNLGFTLSDGARTALNNAVPFATEYWRAGLETDPSLPSPYVVRMAAEATIERRGLGYNQVWREVSSSRSYGTVYQNTTGRPIQVVVTTDVYGGGQFNVSPNGTSWINTGGGTNPNDQNRNTSSTIVPPDWYYRQNGSSGAVRWVELS